METKLFFGILCFAADFRSDHRHNVCDLLSAVTSTPPVIQSTTEWTLQQVLWETSYQINLSSNSRMKSESFQRNTIKTKLYEA